MRKDKIIKKQASAVSQSMADIICPPQLSRSCIPMIIICGPPAAGKSTYVRTHAQPADKIIDLDTIAAQLSGLPEHGWPDEWLRPALIARNQYLSELSRRTSHQYQMAWLIVSAPQRVTREWWKDKLGAKQVIIIETPEAVCLMRIAQDTARIDKAKVSLAVTKWWGAYIRQTGEIIVKE